MVEDFFETCLAAARRDLETINSSCCDQKYERFEDLEFEEDRVFARIEFACRATLNELNILVEHELYRAAIPGWLGSKRSRGPKTLRELGESQTIRDLRDITELKRLDEVLDLIERYHGLRVTDLRSWEQIKQLRSTINDLKHRDGRLLPKDLKENSEGALFLPQYHQFDQELVESAIKHVTAFLLAFAERC